LVKNFPKEGKRGKGRFPGARLNLPLPDWDQDWFIWPGGPKKGISEGKP